MELKVIGTGSSGNCYLFSEQGRYLIVEAGVSFDKVNEYIKGRIGKVEAVLVTHEHKDHAGHAKAYKKHGLRLFASQGTANIVGQGVQAIAPLKWVQFGPFVVIPFHVQHNASEPYGFVIKTQSAGTTLFATDLSEAPSLLLTSQIDTMVVEANYCQELFWQHTMAKGEAPGTRHHLSIQQSAAWCNEIGPSQAILIHGSDRFSPMDAEILRQYDCPTQIARNGNLYEIGINF